VFGDKAGQFWWEIINVRMRDQTQKKGKERSEQKDMNGIREGVKKEIGRKVSGRRWRLSEMRIDSHPTPTADTPNISAFLRQFLVDVN
jgi:hypothetical protein